MSRRLVAAFTLTLAVVAPLIALGPPASAHEDLVSSEPAPDQVLSSAPTKVRLTFTAEPLDIGMAIRVVDPAGTDWAAASPVREGAEVVVGLEPGVPDGGYEVRWRVVSADGHPIAGVVAFTVGQARAAPTATSPATEPEGSAPPLDEAVPASSSEAEGGRVAVPDALRSALIAVVGAGLALGLVALLLHPRHPRRRGPAVGPDDPAPAAPSSPS